MAQLRLMVFGPPRLERDGRPIDLGLRKAVALCAYLAVSRQPQSRDALATLLWPDHDQREARASLRRTLHRLAHAVGDELLLASGDRVTIDPAAELWVDANAFERLAADDPAAAVELYHDDFLAGFTLPDSAAFDEWQFFERERLRQQLALLLERLARLAGARGAWDEATSYARRWVALDQLHEPAQRALLEAYAQSGQAAAAQRQYQELARVLEAELGAEPEEATTELFEAIRSRRFPPAPAHVAPPSAEAAPALPPGAPAAPAPPLVGRGRELAELLQLLGEAGGQRLVTLSGPGGAGKTRLAQALAEQLRPRLAHGAHLVALAEVADPAGIARAVATQLGLPIRGGDVEGQLLGALRERELLLVLDNFEHLLDGAPLVAAIVGAAPRARILITSRERLGLGEELVYAIGGLGLPAEGAGAEALGAEAAQLLLQRARLLRPELAPGPDEAAAIARICRLVQGMPLALTLAASWAELLSFAEIGDEIARSLHFLSTDQRDVPERQRSIRAVFEGSWGRLSPEARRVFARLTVFRGGFTRRAAEAVAGADLQTLRRLVTSSFLSANTPGQRYEIHELLRQLAAEACAGDPTLAEAAAAHSAYYLDQLRRLTGALKGARQRAAAAEIAADFDNLRVAWQHAVARADRAAVAGAAEGFWIFCEIYGDAATGQAAFADALAAIEAAGEADDGLAGFLLAAQGHFHARRSAFASGRELMERGVARMRRAASDLPLGLALVYLGFLCRYQGRFAEAERLGEESLACFAEADDHWGVALSLQLMGTSLARQGRPVLAQQLLQACLETARAAGAYGSHSFAAWNLARVLAGFGDYPAAQRLLEEAIAVGREAGYRLSVASALTERALLALDLGDLDGAERDFAASVELYEAIGSPVFAETTRGHMGALARLRGDLPAAEALLLRGLEHTRSLQNRRDEALFLGELALVAARQGDLPRAMRLQEDALAIWRAIGNEPGLAAAACQLAATQAALGAAPSVVEPLARTALDLAQRHRLAPLALAAFLSLAPVLAARGEPEAAVELLALAERHPAASFETRAQAVALAAGLAAELAPAAHAAARERGAALDWRVVARRWAADQQGARGRPIPTNLDNERQPLIGRDWQLAELAGLLSLPERRLITIHGPGGIGKTRLAQEAGLVALEQFPDGAWFVALAPLVDPEQIVGAIIEAMGMRPGDGDLWAQLAGYLRARRLLLILDNFEQLLAGADLLGELLRHAPRVTLLVTSRERLNLADELVVPLGGIEVPPDEQDERALERGAVRLLLQRARQARPALELTPPELDAVIRICRLVDGMPLALILAASWADMIPFSAIAAEIARSLDFLEGELRDLPARQRSVRAVFDVAWQRLPAAAQRAFARLSAFRGGFTREAAAQVAGADLRTLRTLLNSAFVAAETSERYGVHELLRQYGAERLAELGEQRSTLERHSAYYLELLHGLEPDLRRARQAETFQLIERDLENVRQAWSHALEQRERQLIDRALTTVHLFGEKRGRFRQGAELLLQARERLAPAPEDDARLWQRLTTRLSLLSSYFPRGERVPLLEIERCLALARERGDRFEEALTSFAYGTYYGRTENNYAAAMVHLEAAHKLFAALDDRFYLAESLARVGICKGYTGDVEAFERLCREGYAIARADENLIGMLIAQGNLLEALLHRGQYDEVARYAERHIALTEQLGARNGLCHALESLALVRFLTGDLASARALATRGYTLSAEISNSGIMAGCLSVLALQAAVSGDYLLALRNLAESEAQWPNRLAMVHNRWAEAIARLGLDRLSEAAASLRAAFRAARYFTSPAPRAWLLPVAALLAARAGESERAAELLALAEAHPFRAAGWMGRWAPLATLRGELEAVLGAAAFAAAWERGAAQELDALAAELSGEARAA